MSATSQLRDAVHWSFARMAIDPRAAARAGAAVARCLAELDGSVWPEVVTRFSGLNADGSPLELAFSSRDEALRFTCETGTPELAERDRLARAARIAGELGCVVTEPARIEAMQVDGPLAWGAAISGRYDASSERYKLYVEPQPRSLGHHAPGLASKLELAALQLAPRLVMIGCDLGRGAVEYYMRSNGLAPGELARIATACGFADRRHELEHAISLAWEGSADRALQGVWGLSFAVSRDDADEVVAISVFKEVNALLGGDATARSRLLQLVATLDAGSLDSYARVSEPLTTSDGTGAHGMLAITVAKDRPLELRVGLSPLAVWRAR